MTGTGDPAHQPITLRVPASCAAPVILTSPHSGRQYEPAFLAATRLDPMTLRRSEDSFVEELFAAAPGLGAPLLAANFPRAWCDVNREAWELDPAMFAEALPAYVNASSPRVTAGLGTIARIVGAGEPIYARKLSFAEAETRVRTCWQPFHAALRQVIDQMVAQFGVCLLLDCHSMPSSGGRQFRQPDIVLGDGHGTACVPAVTAFMQAELGRLGFTVRRNDPYAGGYITRHYGHPQAGVQVIQIEMARALYMDEARFTKSRNFTQLQALLGQFLQSLLAAARDITRNAGTTLAAE